MRQDGGPVARTPRRHESEGGLLAPYEETIDSWPGDDRRSWRKRRHTATRVYVRLRDEEGYAGSYSTVQRHARRRREEMARERDRRDAEGFLTLRWLPGEVQVDFGEADFKVRGVTTRGKYLTVTFPHSNVGLTQVFWGETAECVCQGLRNIFEFVGGVPRRAVFDNATEVGRRVGGEVRASGLFRRFAAHYGLGYTLASPPLGQREGRRREQGRPPQEEPLRPRPVVPRRRGVQSQAARRLPRPERGQAPLQAR